MLRIEDGAIYLTRGDTAYISVALADINGEKYLPTEGDKIYFSVKKDVNDEEYSFQLVTACSEDTVFNIIPENTRELEYGKYFYDIQIVTADGEVYTIVEKSNFYLREEVTV